MSRHRFFLEEQLPGAGVREAVQLPLSAADVHHAVSVLRVRPGEELDVVEPGGLVWHVRVAAAGLDALSATLLGPIASTCSDLGFVTLVFGISKGSKNDDIVEGAVEVGAARILPVITARSIVKLDADKVAERGARWRRVALAAAKQSKRVSVPEVSDPASFEVILPELAGYDLVIVAWEESGVSARGVRDAVAHVLAAATPPADAVIHVAVVVGPEGGFTAEEIAALETIGAVPVTLGATILRAETAAVVATALVIHELGGLGNAR